MEIERKWMVKGWPEGLPLREEFAMRQGYISVRPTVRIREEALTGGRTDYILCFKSGRRCCKRFNSPGGVSVQVFISLFLSEFT